MARSISLQETENIVEWIHEIRAVSHNELKIKISQNTSDGDQFIPILRKIQNILHQLSIRLYDKGIDIPHSNELQMALRYLGSETMISLITHLTKVTEHIEEMSRLVLDILCYLMALDPACPLSFPTIFASCVIYVNSSLWPSAIEVIISQLCYYALPLAILYPHESKGVLDSLSISAALMLILDNQYCEPKHHLLMINVLMQIKLNACTDLLSVIAYGTPASRTNALKLLLHYWPLAYTSDHSYVETYDNLDISLPECEATSCPNPASYLCLERACSSQFSKLHSKDGTKKLYSLMCTSCDAVFHRNLTYDHKRLKIVRPIRDVKPNCELHKVCVEEDSIKRASVTCYGDTCTAIQNGYPIRLCHDCHIAQHDQLNDPLHIYQIGPQNPWKYEDLTAKSAFLEAISKLINTPPARVARKESQRRNSSVTQGTIPHYSISVTDSREGLLLLYQYCVPDEPVTEIRLKEWLEHLIALVLEWLRLFNDLLQDSAGDLNDERSFLPLLALKNSESLYSNNRELNGLIVNNVIPWLKSVCESGNINCISNTLLPNLLGHVQVGKLWEYSSKPIERYYRTLTILVLLVKNTFLPQEALDEIYNTVMPEWMDLLIQLRQFPGHTEKLKHLFHVIFPLNLIHDIRIKRFGFIREKFFQKSSKCKQQALFWLQDLSRLSIVVPYTAHIFEASLIKKSGRTEIEDDELAMPLIRRESTGSISGYESETGLVSQTSVDGSDAQAIIHLNFALPRYILMLDIWNSQLNLNVTTLGYEVCQKYLVHMLKNDWGNSHDHNDISNTCILCQAVSLWFSLTHRILQHYFEEYADEKDDNNDAGASPISKRGRVSLKFSIPSLKKRLTQNDISVTPSDEFDEQSDKRLTLTKTASGEANEEPIKISQLRDRRPPILTRHSELDLSSAAAATLMTSGRSVNRGVVDQPSHLYSIFQLSAEKLGAMYYPDTIMQIINFISLLITKGNILSSVENYTSVLSDGHKLMDKLWKLMDGDVSYVNQACVFLLISCQDELIGKECTSFIQSVQTSCLWKLLHDGFNRKNPFKTVDKLTTILQFISTTTNDGYITRVLTHTELILAQAFCKMVRFIQDKDTKISTRVYYCLSNMKQEAIENVRTYMLTLFCKIPSCRDLVIQTLSIINSSIPQIYFVTIVYLLKLLTAADVLKSHDMEDSIDIHPPSTSKKLSDASVLSGRGKESRPSTTSSVFSINFDEDDPQALHCDALSLLLEFIGNKNTNFEDTVFPTRVGGGRRVTRFTSGEESVADKLLSIFEVLMGRKFRIPPRSLNTTRLFETFIVKVYKILDNNVQFSQTKGFITFILRLLGYSASSTREHYPLNGTDGRCTCTLGNIPNHLQAHWLRVLFIILYKYSHLIIGNKIHENSLIYCIELIVNTIQSNVHVCTLPPHHKTSHISKPSTIQQTEDTAVPTSPVEIFMRIERRTLDTVPEETSIKTLTTNTKPPVLHSGSVASISSTYTSSVSVDQDIHYIDNHCICTECQIPIDVYTEDVISLCILCIGTCTHRLPSLMSSHLSDWIIPSIAKVVIPGHYYWQTSNVHNPTPGSGMSIARKFLLTVLTQFCDRRLFLYLFHHNYEDKVDMIFNAITICLAEQSIVTNEEEDTVDTLCLTLASPIEYFLEDVMTSSLFNQQVTVQSLMNLASYLELINVETFGHLFYNLQYLEVFLKKLKEQLDVLHEAFHYFLRIVIQLLKFFDPSVLHQAPPTSITLTAILQEFPDILSEGLHNVYIPAGGLVTIVGVWNKAFVQYPTKRRDIAKKYLLLKLLIDEFSNGLTQQTAALLPENLISLCQSFLVLLNEYTYLGYIDTLWEDRVFTPQLVNQDNIQMGNLVSSWEGLEVAFHNSMRYAINYLACETCKTSLENACQIKLLISQLVALRINRSKYPLDIVRRIFEGQYSFSWVEKSIIKTRHSKSSNTDNKDFRVTDHMNSILLLGWLFIGSLCHNSIHATVIRAGLDKMQVLTECEILTRLTSPINEAVDNVLHLVLSALKLLVEKMQMAYWGLNLILCFCTIWTVYMELYGGDTAIPELTNFWRIVVDKILELRSKPGWLMCIQDIVETFCIQTLIPLKKASSAISCFTLLLPTWKRVINILPNREKDDLPDYSTVKEINIDQWYREMLKRFTELESKYHS